MKKIITIILIYFGVSICGMLQCIADTSDYRTFSEVMMSDGKLLANFTPDEMNECFKHVHKPKFVGFNIYIENKNVDASYISNTLYSIENTSSTDVTYDVSIDVEKNNKVSVSANGSLNGSFSSGKSSDAKKEIGGKCGVEINKTTTTSVKEKETMKVVVEANSKMIIYLTGDLSVTNGVASYYSWFMRLYEGGFEIVTLKNQYSRIEKSSI